MLFKYFLNDSEMISVAPIFIKADPLYSINNFENAYKKKLVDKEACVGLFLDLSKASNLVNHNIY